jgi:hypothetical protein
MNQLLFTVEEENLLCVFDTSSRDALIAGIYDAIDYFEESEMREIADSTLHKLNALTGEEFSELIFSPVYLDDESEV